MRTTRNKTAVSEILGAMLLLGITVLAFSIIYFYLVSDNGPAPETHVFLVGDIEGNQLILTHKGGELLAASNKISFIVAGETQLCLIEDYLNDTNENGKWDLGESVIFDNFTVNLSNLDQYESIGVQAIDDYGNAIKFQGPVFTNYRSDVGLLVEVDDPTPVQGSIITIVVKAWCFGGDVDAAGGVIIDCTLPEGLIHVSNFTEKGSYTNKTGLWHLGNLLVEESPVNLTIHARVNAVPYHEPTQMGIIFDGSDYTESAAFKNTYLNGLMFALDPVKFGLIPTDGAVELTVVGFGFNNPPRAFTVLSPTTIEDPSQAHSIATGQGIRNDDCVGGKAAMSSAIRLLTDKMYNSENFTEEQRQIVLIVSSGNPECIWDEDSPANTVDIYAGKFTSDKSQVQEDTINAKEYLNLTFDFNASNDELNAMTVAKDISLRNSTFLNASIVMPQPGNIYSMENPIVDPGWVFEVDLGKNSFQEAFNLILQTLFNSISMQVYVEDSTTIDPNSNNDYYYVRIQPVFV